MVSIAVAPMRKQGVPRPRPLHSDDGSGDMSDGGPQPSRRSSRMRVPTSKADPDALKSSNQASFESGQEPANDTTQHRTRGTVATTNGSGKILEASSTAEEGLSSEKKGDFVEDKKLNTLAHVSGQNWYHTIACRGRDWLCFGGWLS